MSVTLKHLASLQRNLLLSHFPALVLPVYFGHLLAEYLHNTTLLELFLYFANLFFKFISYE